MKGLLQTTIIFKSSLSKEMFLKRISSFVELRSLNSNLWYINNIRRNSKKYVGLFNENKFEFEPLIKYSRGPVIIIKGMVYERSNYTIINIRLSLSKMLKFSLALSLVGTYFVLGVNYWIRDLQIPKLYIYGIILLIPVIFYIPIMIAFNYEVN